MILRIVIASIIIILGVIGIRQSWLQHIQRDAYLSVPTQVSGYDLVRNKEAWIGHYVQVNLPSLFELGLEGPEAPYLVLTDGKCAILITPGTKAQQVTQYIGVIKSTDNNFIGHISQYMPAIRNAFAEGGDLTLDLDASIPHDTRFIILTGILIWVVFTATIFLLSSFSRK